MLALTLFVHDVMNVRMTRRPLRFRHRIIFTCMFPISDSNKTYKLSTEVYLEEISSSVTLAAKVSQFRLPAWM